MAATTPPLLPTIHRTEVDGVPVLWSEAPGQTTMALMFRVGRADERPADGGLTHIVEHLAMSRIGQPRYDHNAFVEGLRTVFFATGSDAELAAFFDGVVGALVDPPLDRFEKERDVLKREAAGRGHGVVETHLQYRFGTAGHGLVGLPEFGLGRVAEADVAAWVASNFVRGNAMAFLTGAPPADLRVEVRDGDRRRVPPLGAEPSVKLPAHLRLEVPGVSVGALIRRELGATSMLSIYHRRLRQRLRLEQGLMYEVMADYQPLGAEWASMLVGGECEPDRAQEVTDIALEELDRLARGDVNQAELDDELADHARSLADPTAVGGLLDAMVTDALLGMPERGPAERYEEQRSTTADHIAARAAEARASLLLVADIEHHPDDLAPYPMTSSEIVGGREVKPLLSLFGFGPKHRLIIGPEGVSVRHKDGSVATVRYADCVILERPNDEDVVLWGRDGSRLWVPSAFWRGGEAVVAEIVAAVPGDIIIRDRFSDDYYAD